MSVQESLRRGVFAVAACDACGIRHWPPAPYCRSCSSKTSTAPHPTEGTLIEYATRDGVVFCVCRLGEIRVMGRLLRLCPEGSAIRMTGCGMSDGVPFFEFTPC